MTLKIEKNIPIPSLRTSSSLNLPLDEMELFDSVSVPLPPNSDMKLRTLDGKIRSFISFHKDDDKRFTLRTMREEKAIRVWRIK